MFYKSEFLQRHYRCMWSYFYFICETRPRSYCVLVYKSYYTNLSPVGFLPDITLNRVDPNKNALVNLLICLMFKYCTSCI